MINYIGITGKLGAGKETVGEILVDKLNIKKYSYGDLLREKVKERGMEVNRSNLISLGNEMRKERGNGILSKLILKKTKGEGILVGIRNPGEVKVLREKLGRDFLLIAVVAPAELRFERLYDRKREDYPETYEEFKKRDRREDGVGEPDYGQRVSECIKMADEVIVNDSGLEDLKEKVEKVIRKIRASTES